MLCLLFYGPTHYTISRQYIYMVENLDRRWEEWGEVLHFFHTSDGVSSLPITGARQLQNVFVR